MSAAITIVSGLVVTIIGVASFVLSTRAQRATAKGAIASVEAGAYGRATDIYEQTVKRLENETTRLAGQVSDLDARVVTLTSTNEALTAEIRELRRTNEALTRELHRYRGSQEDPFPA